MNVKQFEQDYGLKHEDVMSAIKQARIPWKMVDGSPDIAENDTPKLLPYLQGKSSVLDAELTEKATALAEEAAALAEEEQRYRELTSQMLISSGFSFDGYKIVKYSGYISGDDCVTLPRATFWGGSVDKNLCDALVKIRRQAIAELKKAAYELGCNAVVGVDFDYITMDPQHAGTLNASITVYEPYVICVTANGNAVLIEKDE